MPRSIWNGTIAFGMVRVPVKLYTATESKVVRFHERHAPDGAPVKHKRYCAKEDREVPYKEIVKGYEASRGKWVVLEKDEVAAAAGAAAHVVCVEHFVCREEIDPVFYDHSYRLGPGKGGDDGYRVLHAALEKADRVGIGRFVFHDRERLVAIRADGEVLTLHTLRFEADLVSPGGLDIPSGGRKPNAREADMATTLVDRLSGEFSPRRYKDEHRDAVLALIKRKAKGEEIEVREEPEPEPAGDLLAALEASLEGADKAQGEGKKGSGRSSSSSRSTTRRRGGSTSTSSSRSRSRSH